MINLILLAYSVLLLCAIVRSQLLAHRSRETDWKELADSLCAVRTAGIFALSCLEMQGMAPCQTEVKKYLTSLGGIEGLDRMQHNLQILIKIAHQISARNQGMCSLTVSEIRKDYAKLRVILFLLRILLYSHRFGSYTFCSLRYAAKTYRRAVEQLVKLYEDYSPRDKSRILAACNWQTS